MTDFTPPPPAAWDRARASGEPQPAEPVDEPARDRRVYAGAAALFDEARNTSRVKPVPPDALPNALRALEAGRGSDWYAWVEKRARGEHDHAARRQDGSRAACPVQECRAPLDP